MSGLSKDRIVVPIDFSDESFAAIDTALEIANTPSGVHVIHVLGELAVALAGGFSSSAASPTWRLCFEERRSSA